MRTRICASAGSVGLFMIFTFWTATVISELFGSYETIAVLKGWFLVGIFILIPAEPIVGGSVMWLGVGCSEKLVSTKKKRMPMIAANGMLILRPMASRFRVAIAAHQRSSCLGRGMVPVDTLAVHLVKPAEFTFLAGQTIQLAIQSDAP